MQDSSDDIMGSLAVSPVIGGAVSEGIGASSSSPTDDKERGGTIHKIVEKVRKTGSSKRLPEKEKEKGPEDITKPKPKYEPDNPASEDEDDDQDDDEFFEEPGAVEKVEEQDEEESKGKRILKKVTDTASLTLNTLTSLATGKGPASKSRAVQEELLCEQGHNLRRREPRVPPGTKAKKKLQRIPCDQCANLIPEDEVFFGCGRCMYALCKNCFTIRLDKEVTPSITKLEPNLMAVAEHYPCSSGATDHRMAVVTAEDPKAVEGMECSRCRKTRLSEPGLRCAHDCPDSFICAHCVMFDSELEARSSALMPGEMPKFPGIKCTRHHCKVITTTLEDRRLFFDFNCILCPYRRRDKSLVGSSSLPRKSAGKGKHKRDKSFLPGLSRSTLQPKRGHVVEIPPVRPGDEVVLCPHQRCRLQLCLDCANFVVRQRRIAREQNPTDLEGCTVSLSLEQGRKPYRCHVCDQWKVPDEESTRPLVYFHHAKTAFSMCIDCAEDHALETEIKKSTVLGTSTINALKEAIQEKETDEDTNGIFAIFYKWKAFALKQEQLFEKNFLTKSIMECPGIDKSTEAFRQLEFKVHSSLSMPVPIIYEVELTAAANSSQLNPLIWRLLQESNWPLHTALRLLALSRDCEKKFALTRAIWKIQSARLEAVSLDMLDNLVRPELLRQLVLNPKPTGMLPKPILQLAVDADHEHFLAHSSIQLLVLQKWLSPIRMDEDMSPASFFVSRIVLALFGLLVFISNKLTFGLFAKQLTTIQDRQRHPIAAHFTRPDKSKEFMFEYFSYSPKTSFQLYSLFYLAFAVIVSWTAIKGSSHDFAAREVLICIWVLGLWLVEISQFIELRLDYFSSVWNFFDIIHLSSYTAAMGIKIAVAKMTPDSFNERRYLEGYECVLALSVFMTYMRGLYICRTFRSLGPLLVSFGKMLRDVGTWFILALVVTVAVSISLMKLFVPLDSAYVQGGNHLSPRPQIVVDQTPFTLGTDLSPPTYLAFEDSNTSSSSNATEIDGIHFATVFKSLIWGMTNVPMFDGSSYEYLNWNNMSQGRRVVAEVMMTVFMVMVTLVLINLLVAVMNSTYSKATDDMDVGHKVSFVKVVEEYAETPPVPPPLNIFTMVIWPLINLFTALLKKIPTFCCSFGNRIIRFREKSPWSEPEPGQLCINIHKHTKNYLPMRRLNLALSGESAIRFYVSQWLATATPPSGEEDEALALQKTVKELTSEVERLKGIIESLGAKSESSSK